jgi:hypothetical protein
MKDVTSIIILFLLSVVSCQGQGNGRIFKRDSVLSKNYSLKFFENCSVDRECCIAYWSLEKIYKSEKDTTNLKKIWRSVLNEKNYKINTEYCWREISNDAASQFSYLYENKAKYDSALFYLYLSDTVYKYVTQCGNAYDMHRITTACRYADIYLKLNNKEKALSALLKEGLNRESRKHIEKLNKFFLKLDKQKLKKELNTAINNYKTDTTEGTHSSKKNYIEFLNEKMVFTYYDYEDNEPNDKAKVIAYLKTMDLYKMVMKL